MNLDNKIKKANYIFLDCFDTVLFRTISPEDVFKEWFKLISRKYNIDKEKIESAWYVGNCYLTKKKLVVNDLREEVSFSEKLIEFYGRLFAGKNKDIPFNDFSDFCLNSMLNIEDRVCVVNDELLKKLKGKKVICISDFYLPTRTMEELFEKKGIHEQFSKIYISSDIGLRKSTGNLYEYVIDDLKKDKEIEYSEILMIGDNRHSDFVMAKRNGMDAFLYKNKHMIKDEICRCANELAGLYEKCGKKTFSNYCYSLYLFCDELYNSIKDKTNRIYFFSREGQALIKMFEKYLQLNGVSDIEPVYMYTSRQATYLASLKQLDVENFEQMRKQSNSLSIKEWLKSINLYNQVLDLPYFSQIDFDKKIENFFDSEEYKKFKLESTFVDLYESERKKAKEEAINYYTAIGIRRNDNVHIVDIGWKGTIQDNIYSIYNGEIDLHGYYYGLYGMVKNESNNEKKGCVYFDYPYKSSNFEIYSINTRLLEEILSANHGSCMMYKDTKPVCRDITDDEIELYDKVEKIQNIIIDKFRKINEIRNKYDKKIFVAACQIMHLKLTLNISKGRMKQEVWMTSKAKDNFVNFGKLNGFSLSNCKEMLRNYMKNPLEFAQKIMKLCVRYHLSFVSRITGNLFFFIYRNRIIKMEYEDRIFD